MTDAYLLQELIEFFLESFSEDPAGVGEWLAQGDIDADEFIAAVRVRHNVLSEA